MPQSGAEQLVVRQHERFVCRLPSHMRVAEEASEQVMLGRSVVDGTGTLSMVITDASRGGLGVESNVFFPRGCRLKIRVEDGTETVHELTLRVQRVTMIDRKPTYYIGLSFVSKGPENDLGVGLLLEQARQAAAATARTAPTAPLKGGG